MILKELSEAVGVSGKEDAVRDIILREISGHVEALQIDSMGNITARKSATVENPVRVMIAAHMDEIGFMVTGFDGEGLIRFTNIGGVDDRILPGLRVRVGDDLIPGVIIWTPIHQDSSQNTTKISSLRIDIGANSKDEINGKVKRGDRIAFDSKFMELGSKTLRGKALDDRVGCALLIELLKGDSYPVEILAAFTVQEEIGLRGATVAAQTLNPDLAFVLEATPAHDLPDPLADPDKDEPLNPGCRLGDGPTLTVMDSGLIVNPRLLQFIRDTAEQQGIPYQLKTRVGGGTDAGVIHRANGGAASAVISMPCRYIHSPSAYLHRDDYANGLKLLRAVLGNLTGTTFKSF